MIPPHVAIIMDGNGRWAKMRRLPRVFGHRAAMSAVKTVIKTASDAGIKYLSLFAFSTENWSRPKAEVNALMSLLKSYLSREISELKKNSVRVVTSGDVSEMPSAVQKVLDRARSETSGCGGMVLNLCLNYGSRKEIVRAVNRLMESGRKKIGEKEFAAELYTAGIPDPDLIIRTSGEKRISNFMLWQIAYTELYFTPALWPDFGKKDFLEAIEEYSNRERRFGGI